MHNIRKCMLLSLFSVLSINAMENGFVHDIERQSGLYSGWKDDLQRRVHRTGNDLRHIERQIDHVKRTAGIEPWSLLQFKETTRDLHLDASKYLRAKFPAEKNNR